MNGSERPRDGDTLSFPLEMAEGCPRLRVSGHIGFICDYGKGKGCEERKRASKNIPLKIDLLWYISLQFILALAPFLASCSNNQESKTSPDYAHASWPVFRGDRGLSGVADATLPDAPKLLWSRDTGAEISSSPAIGLGSVFIASKDGKVYSLDIRNGNIQWMFDAKDNIEAPPLLLDQTVYIGNLNGEFFALDARSGKVKWRAETGGDIMGSANGAIDPESGKTRVFVGSYDSKMYCFDADTGELKWTYETGSYINGAPAADGRNIVFGGCDQMLHIVSVSDGSKLGEVNAGSFIAGSAALADNRAYAGNYEGKLVCIDIPGRQITWEYEDRESGGEFFSSPAVADNRVYIGSRDRCLHCVDRETGGLVWKFRTRDKVDSSPVIAGDKVVFGSADGRLYIVDRQDGKEIWSYETGAPIPGSPAVIDGMAVVGAADGRVYAFGEGK